MILSSNVLVLLSQQYAREVSNSLVYDLFSSWAADNGLTGTEKLMKSQADGERGHASKVLAYISDRNAKLIPESIMLTTPPTGFFDLLTRYQQLERDTTDQIMVLHAGAYQAEDYATCAWLNQPGGLVLEQVEEEALVQTILDRAAIRTGNDSLTGEDLGESIHDLDIFIGKRA